MYQFQFKRTKGDDPDFIKLVDLLNGDMRITDGDDFDFYFQFNALDTIKQVIVVYEQNTAVGCGALRPYSEETVELKRMFVHHDHRRKGIAILLLGELERWAIESGFSTAILETGINQTAAIALYKKTGYAVIPNYGQYTGIETSVCMSKTLEKN
jgi:GNAT superfamily N-acetyltransferase